MFLFVRAYWSLHSATLTAPHISLSHPGLGDSRKRLSEFLVLRLLPMGAGVLQNRFSFAELLLMTARQGAALPVLPVPWRRPSPPRVTLPAECYQTSLWSGLQFLL